MPFGNIHGFSVHCAACELEKSLFFFNVWFFHVGENTLSCSGDLIDVKPGWAVHHSGAPPSRRSSSSATCSGLEKRGFLFTRRVAGDHLPASQSHFAHLLVDCTFSSFALICLTLQFFPTCQLNTQLLTTTCTYARKNRETGTHSLDHRSGYAILDHPSVFSLSSPSPLSFLSFSRSPTLVILDPARVVSRRVLKSSSRDLTRPTMDLSPSSRPPPQLQKSAETTASRPSTSWSQNQDHDAKRPATSQSQSQLLPPLELLSSSPGLPNNASARRPSRPVSSSKISAPTINSHAYLKYPTPVPTSSTGILSSSPPRVNANANATAAGVVRPPLQRAPSVVSERAPLSAVPSIELNENGETLLMGRSSNSSHYQLSANRLISRVHVKARYVPASLPLQPNKIEVECNGWNGLKLSSQGRAWEMQKGDVLTFDTEGAEIMIDVQDARVLVHWPKRERDPLADLGWEDSPRSVRNGASPAPNGGNVIGSPRAGNGLGLGLLQSSPLRRTARISSPVSPTPAHASLPQLNGDAPANSQNSSILSDLPSVSDRERSVEIYEDDDADRPSTADQSFITDINKSFSSDLSDLQSDDENDPDEENDPIIHSFGPYGANLNSRLASFSTASPKRRRLESGGFASPKVASASRALAEAANDSRRSSKSASTPRQGSIKASPALEELEAPAAIPDLSHVNVATITNHVVNQLAFSRLSSTPLSTLLSNLPAEDKHGLKREELKYIVESTTCIGTIPRQGKDADGKPLESQYYYVPEADSDQSRRAAVVDGLRKPTLRNCRKHHVVSHSSSRKERNLVRALIVTSCCNDLLRVTMAHTYLAILLETAPNTLDGQDIVTTRCRTLKDDQDHRASSDCLWMLNSSPFRLPSTPRHLDHQARSRETCGKAEDSLHGILHPQNPNIQRPVKIGLGRPSCCHMFPPICLS